MWFASLLVHLVIINKYSQNLTLANFWQNGRVGWEMDGCSVKSCTLHQITTNLRNA